MTLIIGWIDEECVYITGDTVVTRTFTRRTEEKIRGGRNEENPLNENVIQVNSNEIKLREQEALKIYEINKHVVYAFAGEGLRGHEIAIYLRDNFEKEKSLSANLNSAVQSLGSGGIQCLLGKYEAEIKGQLVSLNFANKTGEAFEHKNGDVIVLGTPYWGSDKGFLNRTFKEVYAKCKGIERVLIGFCAFIQSHIIRKQLINIGVGGIYCGVCLSEKNYWTDNFLIVQYSYEDQDIKDGKLQRLKESDLTFVSLLEGKLASIFTRNGRFEKVNTIYSHLQSYSYNKSSYLFGISTMDWLEKYKEKIDRRLENLKIKYIIYIDKNTVQKNRVVIAKMDDIFKKYSDIFWSESKIKLLTGYDILYGLSPFLRKGEGEIEWYN